MCYISYVFMCKYILCVLVYGINYGSYVSYFDHVGHVPKYSRMTVLEFSQINVYTYPFIIYNHFITATSNHSLDEICIR